MSVIAAKSRMAGVKLDTLEKSGEIPAVFYGAGKTSTSISVSKIEFKKVWLKAGESSTVKVATSAGELDTLIHEVQVDPVTEEPIHVDFLVVDMTKKIKVKVPLEFEGISNAVKNGIGNLVKVLHEIEIEALPGDLPHSLFVDISKLETLQDTIVVSDIRLPAGVVAITAPNEIVASIVEQKEEKLDEPVAPVDLSAIEVEKKGKKEEEGEAVAEAPAEAGKKE
ncbi:MAG TPA: 50S ribosomal protein L25 [Candidatus Paceibacterota bacterium]